MNTISLDITQLSFSLISISNSITDVFREKFIKNGQMIRLPSQYFFFLYPPGAADRHGFGTVDLDHLLDFPTPTFYPRVPVYLLPIQISHWKQTHTNWKQV